MPLPLSHNPPVLTWWLLVLPSGRWGTGRTARPIGTRSWSRFGVQQSTVTASSVFSSFIPWAEVRRNLWNNTSVETWAPYTCISQAYLNLSVDWLKGRARAWARTSWSYWKRSSPRCTGSWPQSTPPRRTMSSPRRTTAYWPWGR